MKNSLRLSELLEEVHLASERADSETVKARGSAFLEGLSTTYEKFIRIGKGDSRSG